MTNATGPSLRDFLAEHFANFVHVKKPVPLNHVGAVTARVGRPILFEHLEEFAGWQLTDNLFVDRPAQARVLGCEATGVVPALAKVLAHGPRPLVEVDDAPCQTSVALGDDIDLSTIPIVTHTDQDPYPYTTGFAIHRDPVRGHFNQMFPRSGVLSSREMVSSFVTSTANRFLAEHRSAGTPMPQAIVIGAHPAWELAGVYSHPHDDWWELELFEAIAGRPGEVTRCRTVDLVVPADASVVIEGFVHPTRTAQDGPSPGPTMLYTPHASQQPVFEVTAITRRADPIYRNHQMTPWTDHQELPRLFHEAIIYERLRGIGVGIRDVHFAQGGGSLLCILQVDPTFDGQVVDALLSALGSPWLNMKMVVAVDPDIDIYDPRDIQFALATRVDPNTDVVIVRNGRGSPFDPSAHPVESAAPDVAQTRFPSIVGKWAIDATKPVRYRSAERANYERAWPVAWAEARIGDYLE
jgi:2,5-furandicarboxylate decarboxylase 1